MLLDLVGLVPFAQQTVNQGFTVLRFLESRLELQNVLFVASNLQILFAERNQRIAVINSTEYLDSTMITI